MRKARIVLSVVLISGIVTGMLAFRAKKYMAQTYYYCQTYWVTCQSSFTIGAFVTTLFDPNANITIHNATPDPSALGKDCVSGGCTWSNTVYMEPGF